MAPDADSYDVIVIGGGAAGENVAGRTAAGGLRTAVIESALVGGECSYWACMPSKALLRPVSVLDAARRVPGAAGAVTGSVDVEATLATRDDTVSGYDDKHQVEWVESSGITLVRGQARLDGKKRVRVGDRLLTATKAVVVATGSHPITPPIDGLADARPWYSRDATSAKSIPKRLIVLGGGVVAVEMAFAFHSLGSSVTVLVRGTRLIEREEPFAAEELLESFKDAGIDVKFGVEAKSVERSNNNEVTVALNNGSTVVADEILVATGRRPNTGDIGLETVGLPVNKPIVVDDELRSVDLDGDWLYAVGDVNGRALLTHMGKYQARLASDAILGKSVEAWSDHHAVPGVVFTEPQIASVGMRLSVAEDEGLNVRELKVPLTSTAGASVNGIKTGTAQLVVDETRHVVIGATFTGPEVGEMLQAATIAVVGQVPIDRLWHAVPAYPTVSEVWLRLLEQYGL